MSHKSLLGKVIENCGMEGGEVEAISYDKASSCTFFMAQVWYLRKKVVYVV